MDLLVVCFGSSGEGGQEVVLNRPDVQFDELPAAARRDQGQELVIGQSDLLPGVDVAARRLIDALRGGQTIVIYGDYDVDGIAASSILWHVLRLAGADVRPYTPHRLDEGYGLNAQAIRQLVTVALGIDKIKVVWQPRWAKLWLCLRREA